MSQRYTGLIARYRDQLPVADDSRVISLGEGATPLVRLQNLPRDIGFGGEIYVKVEGANPTGSFKDRGMTVAVTRAVDAGAKAVICASTGNTSASAAAYAARAGITAFVLIPEGKIALGKLAQAMVHGARIVQIRGNFDAGMRLVREVAENAPVTIVNSINPFRLQGQKTAAFEITEALQRAPDYHCLPVGNAGNITAHWIGYSELAATTGEVVTQACGHCGGQCPYAGGGSGERPAMVGYQAAGSAPFLRGAVVAEPETAATAIRIGHPQSWDQAWAASRESGGWFDELEDAEILAMQKTLARRDGIFCEPASAASLAGAVRDIERGRIRDGSTVVCTLTGNGLKDPDIAVGDGRMTMATVAAERAAVETVIQEAL